MSPLAENGVLAKAKFWKKKSTKGNNMASQEPTISVTYLGNVPVAMGTIAECMDDSIRVCNTQCSMTKSMAMVLTVCKSGLKALTDKYGLSEFWANRVVCCFVHPEKPKMFIWVYRHIRPSDKQEEFRCHAAMCSKPSKAKVLSDSLHYRIVLSLTEYLREKKHQMDVRRSSATPATESIRSTSDASVSASRLASINEEYFDDDDAMCGQSVMSDNVFDEDTDCLKKPKTSKVTFKEQMNISASFRRAALQSTGEEDDDVFSMVSDSDEGHRET
ncbi:hypothetical protein HDE_00722 [Halotydeus destructor]|nr:hypothetical protein HDE_00722 [Halotydeus destructor]